MARLGIDWPALFGLFACLGLLGCSDGESSAAGSGAAAGAGGSGASAGGSEGSGGSGAASGGSGGTAGSGGSGAAGGGGSGGGPSSEMNLSALGANTSVGLEWNAVQNADSYNVYWAASPGVTPQTGQLLTAAAPNLVHRGLTNGTPYHYVVTAVTGGVESAPSQEQSATPSGEWVLEEFGTGIVEDLRTGGPAGRIPIAQRLHVLLFAEGYTAPDLDQLHSLAGHDSERDNDVDRWVDLVFSIEPYRSFRQAFSVWYLPRASEAHIGSANTAFQVPVDTSSSFPGVGSIQQDGETAARAWQAISAFPFPPSDFAGPSNGTARNLVAAFMIFDPGRGRASVSGRATSLRNPADSAQRISAAFGVGHAHEFTHAFSSVRDEYLEDDNSAPTNWSGTSNVAGTSSCALLPWSHLLEGGAFNPSRGELVGAFGRPQHGYHSELRCLMNGTHDNALYYGGNGLLRVEDRMCNFCREISAFRVHQRSGLVASGNTGFDAWVNDYRTPFFSQHPFFVPAEVPQTNDEGTSFYEACTAAGDRRSSVASVSPALADRRRAGCVLDEP